ncbi:Gfo/Idh/MocA family protein [Duganella sp. BuS-21]|uniref:Gfo/Idh/MocA family protein n=1 Tax=Duganella sp. BuS-21 TaxID=2943848 RepID=UPI0035A5D1BD
MRKLKMGMVGGGQGAFIGHIHRMAIALNGEIQLVCGVFSKDAAVSRASGRELGLAPSRCYDGYREMLATEASLPAGERIDLVAIVTPNASHFEIARMALQYGFHVMCEKPLTLTLAEARELRALAARHERQFAVAHAYAGYPMVVQARQLVSDGAIGTVQKVVVDYVQGWLAEAVLAQRPQSQSQTENWRLDPAQGGAAGCLGDIAIHAAHLAELVSGQAISTVLADLASIGQGRQLDDDVAILLRFGNGARGMLNASQVCVGEENHLTLRVYGSQGSLHWAQQAPDTLALDRAGQPRLSLSSGQPYLCDAARAMGRTPSGHPQGYIEAFANLYRWFYHSMCGTGSTDALPGMAAGVRGMAFIEAALRSNAQGNRWAAIEAEVAA